MRGKGGEGARRCILIIISNTFQGANVFSPPLITPEDGGRPQCSPSALPVDFSSVSGLRGVQTLTEQKPLF